MRHQKPRKGGGVSERRINIEGGEGPKVSSAKWSFLVEVGLKGAIMEGDGQARQTTCSIPLGNHPVCGMVDIDNRMVMPRGQFV